MQSDRISDEELGELSIVRNPFLCPNDGTVLPYGKWRHKESMPKTLARKVVGDGNG